MIEVKFDNDLLPNQFYINEKEHGDLYIVDRIDIMGEFYIICTPFGDILTQTIVLNKPEYIIIK